MFLPLGDDLSPVMSLSPSCLSWTCSRSGSACFRSIPNPHSYCDPTLILPTLVLFVPTPVPLVPTLARFLSYFWNSGLILNFEDKIFL